VAELRILPLADRVEEELIARARAQGGAALGLGLWTFGQLERALLVAAELSPIDGLAAELVAERVAPAEAEPGYAKTFINIYNELRDGGCGAFELAAVSRRLTGLAGQRARAVARTARAYEEALAERGLTDAAGARLCLPEALASCPLPEAVARAGALVIEDVLDLPPARVRILSALAARGVKVILRLPQLADRPGLAAAQGLFERALADAPQLEVEQKSYGGGHLAPLHARLFHPGTGTGTGPGTTVIEADDPAAELRAIVLTVRERLADGVPPDDLCIAVRGLARDRRRIGAALDEAGIPWRDRRGAPALEAPPCALALQLLDLAERNFPRAELSLLLTSRYVEGGVPAFGDDPWIPAQRVAELLRAAGSRDDGPPGHAPRIAVHAARLAAGGHAERARAAERVAERLGALLPALALPAAASIPEHFQALSAALDRIGLPAKCRALEERPPDRAQASADAEAARYPAIDAAAAEALARDQAALRALDAAGAQLLEAARRVGLAATPISRARFRELFAEALAPATVRARGARGGAVLLADASELAGRSFPHLILAGVTDGRFPLRRAIDPLFDDEDRALVNRAAGRPVFRARAAEEPLAFAMACFAARESLTLIAARTDERGQEMVPSPFLEEAVLGPVARRREAAAIVPPAAACASPRQLLARAALLERGAPPADGEPAGALLAAVRADRALAPRLEAALERGRPVAGPSGGRLSSDAARRAVADYLSDRARALGDDIAWVASASALQDYASCPFKFFAGKLLGLDEPDPLDDDLDLREGGSLLHAVARDVFVALQQEGLLPLAGGARAAEERAAAFAACERSLDEWQSRARTGPDPLWALRREQARTFLGRLLEAEVRDGSPLVPSAFEAPFGMDGAPPLMLPSPDGRERIAVRGRVDRVDVAGSEVRVIDYKSGQVKDRFEVDELLRTQFQLALYAAWASARYQATAVDALFRSLRDGTASKTLAGACERRGLAIDALLALDPARRAADRGEAEVAPAAGALDLPDGGYPSLADTTWALFESLRDGRFDVRPHDPTTACRICAFATVCRIDKGTDE
jgi:ATP-dependent helicase/nuclease subunit B